MTNYDRILQKELKFGDVADLINEMVLPWKDGKNLCECCKNDHDGVCPLEEKDSCVFTDHPEYIDRALEEDAEGFDFKRFIKEVTTGK